MQSPVEERKESVMVNMCLDSKKKKKKKGRGGEGVGVARLKKFFSAFSMTIIYRSDWTPLSFMNPDPHHMCRICLVTLSFFSLLNRNETRAHLTE